MAKTPTRDQLAQFLPTFEAIKAFEAMFKEVNEQGAVVDSLGDLAFLSTVGTTHIGPNAATGHVLSENTTTRNLSPVVVTGTAVPAYNRAAATLVHQLPGVIIGATTDVLEIFLTTRVNVSNFFIKTILQYHDSVGVAQQTGNSPDAFYFEVTISSGTETALYLEYWNSQLEIPGMVSNAPSTADLNAAPYTNGSLVVPVIVDFATSLAPATYTINFYMQALDRHNQYHGIQDYNGANPGTLQGTLHFPALSVSVTHSSGKTTVYKR